MNKVSKSIIFLKFLNELSKYNLKLIVFKAYFCSLLLCVGFIAARRKTCKQTGRLKSRKIFHYTN